jgi:hypothetical protein
MKKISLLQGDILSSGNNNLRNMVMDFKQFSNIDACVELLRKDKRQNTLQYCEGKAFLVT